MANDFSSVLEKQRSYFQSGITRPYKFRIEQLKSLRAAIKKHEASITEALHADLNKAPQETFMTEIGPSLAELRFIKNHLNEWMQPQNVPGMIFSFPSRGKIYREPYGTVLIIAPWNYPFWLSVTPLIGAIAAGNCVILKPSEHAVNTAATLRKIFNETFPAEFIAVIEGGPEVSQQLIELPPDYIFYTGSTQIGKIIAQAAAKNLVPYTLELGGKSPCIIDESADLKLAARRMIWGKIIAAGQTCVAPDYLLIHKNVKDAFVNEVKKSLNQFYPRGALNDEDYPRIINQKHFERLKNLMRGGKVLLGGKTDEKQLKIEPTLFEDVHWNDPIMKEEIFGPLLPVLPFDSVNEVIDAINHQPKPLSLYIFSGNKKFQQRILEEVSYGGASVNDTIEHLGNSYLPFGGIGTSGIGSYHGKWSFDTFTHYKGVMKKATWIDLPFRYKPFTKMKGRVMRMFMR
ncbi:MAG TPA: aldehyde dehydrogenase [Chitinophagales bacterium]|nr:aldehyde dehydrogenase [Chitinophagales bacterium]